MSKKLIGLTLALALFAVALPVSASNLTQPQIQAIIGILQSFGAEQSVINSVSVSLGGGTSSNTGSGSSCIELSYNLFSGSTDGTSGGQVTRLQRFLGVSQTGYFGPETEAAVQRWQSSHSIVSSGSPDSTGYGYVGPRTRAAMAQGCDGQTTTTNTTVTNTTPNTTANTTIGGSISIVPDSGAAPLSVTVQFPQEWQSLVRAECANNQPRLGGRTFSIDWGDGSYPNQNGRNVPCATHMYQSAGRYTVRATVYDFSDAPDFNGNFTRNIWNDSDIVTVTKPVPIASTSTQPTSSSTPSAADIIIEEEACGLGANVCPITITWFANNVQKAVLQGAGPLWPTSENIDGPNTDLFGTKRVELPSGEHTFSVSGFNGTSWGNPLKTVVYRRMKSIPPTTELSVTPANKCKIAVGATTCRVTMTWSTNGYYHSVLQGVGPLWPSAANIDGPVPSAPYLDRTASFDLPAGAHIFSVSVFNGSSWGTPKNVTNYIVEAS